MSPKKKDKEPPDDRPMNEAEWERFMQKSDARAAKFGELLETLQDHPDRDAIIGREMGWDRPEDDEEEGDEDFDAQAAIEEAMAHADDEDVKEAVRRSDEELHAMPAYSRAFPFGLKVHEALKKHLEACGGDPGDDVTIAHINSMIIAAKLAGGHGMGYDDHALCGNIACCKRALEAANKCLEALEALKANNVVPRKTLDPLIAEGKEVRRLVEERIADLRKRVWWA
jgi:hypothetical protein